MEVLVSYCVSGKKPGYALGVMHASTLVLRPVMGLFRFAEQKGLELTGLVSDTRFVYLAQRHPATISVLDRNTLRPLRRHMLPQAADLHSLCIQEEQLYVVSTGTDEVICLKMEGPCILSQSVVWRPDPDAPRMDGHHLNGLCFLNGELHVSGFGKRKGDDWRFACEGFIYNIDRSETVVSGLDHPHSLLPLANGVAFCESGCNRIHLPGRSPISDLPGYTRGLCCVGDYLLVGTSARRRVSRSTGKVNQVSGCDGSRDRCTICRIPLESGVVDLMTDLSWHGGEIYDLLTLNP